MPHRVVIVGAGFAGLNAAKALSGNPKVDVTIVDRRNHHLFQPLLYQVATAGLNPADIASPIRGILSRAANIRVLQGVVRMVDFESKFVRTDFGEIGYDHLLLACGSTHSYFGNDHWEPFAPGLKTIEDATGIRQRILSAYEEAERIDDSALRKKLLTFVIVGGGPTGVELAGAIGEMSRHTLARDFRSIDAKSTRIFLMEAGSRILVGFPVELADRAARDLENMGVQIWTSSCVSNIDAGGVQVGNERISAGTVIWAAGVQASPLGKSLGLKTDTQGRVHVSSDLAIPGYCNAFIAGDMACFETDGGTLLPSLAPVAIQQGRFFAETVKRDLAGKPRRSFQYYDKGIMATIGRHRAIAVTGTWKLHGRLAWLAWLLIHVLYLTGFRNRIFVVMQWAWSYLTWRRGARLIVGELPNERESTRPIDAP